MPALRPAAVVVVPPGNRSAEPAARSRRARSRAPPRPRATSTTKYRDDLRRSSPPTTGADRARSRRRRRSTASTRSTSSAPSSASTPTTSTSSTISKATTSRRSATSTPTGSRSPTRASRSTTFVARPRVRRLRRCRRRLRAVDLPRAASGGRRSGARPSTARLSRRPLRARLLPAVLRRPDLRPRPAQSAGGADGLRPGAQQGRPAAARHERARRRSIARSWIPT